MHWRAVRTAGAVGIAQVCCRLRGLCREQSAFERYWRPLAGESSAEQRSLLGEPAGPAFRDACVALLRAQTKLVLFQVPCLSAACPFIQIHPLVLWCLGSRRSGDRTAASSGSTTTTATNYRSLARSNGSSADVHDFAPWHYAIHWHCADHSQVRAEAGVVAVCFVLLCWPPPSASDLRVIASVADPGAHPHGDHPGCWPNFERPCHGGMPGGGGPRGRIASRTCRQRSAHEGPCAV